MFSIKWINSNVPNMLKKCSTQNLETMWQVSFSFHNFNETSYMQVIESYREIEEIGNGHHMHANVSWQMSYVMFGFCLQIKSNKDTDESKTLHTTWWMSLGNREKQK